MRILVAARLSKKADGQTGIDSQDLRMREWARTEGHEVVEVVADTVTGRRPPWKRPNLRVWVTNPGHLCQYDAIAAYALDRLTRGNDAETSQIEAWARDNGKRLLVYTGGLEYPCEGSAGIAWDAAKRIAHQEWLATSERTKRGLGYLRDNGFLTGSLPWGYLAMETGGHKNLVPDPELVPVIREIYDRYMAGGTSVAICQWLKSAGITSKTGGPWYPRSLTRFLRNPILHGRYVDEKGRTILRVRPILSGDEHAALIRRMAERVAPGGQRGNAVAMLHGVVFCSVCGGIMRIRRITAVRADGSKRVNVYYRCDGDAMNPSKCRNMIPAQVIEDSVNLLFAQEDFSAREHTEKTVIPGDSHQHELNTNAEDMAALLAAQDDMAAEAFMDKLAALRAERDRIRALPADPPQVHESGTGISIREYWASLADAQAKRRYLLDAGVTVHMGKGRPVVMAYDTHEVVRALGVL